MAMKLGVVVVVVGAVDVICDADWVFQGAELVMTANFPHYVLLTCE